MAHPTSLKEKAASLGLELAGVAPAGSAPHSRAFLDWLDRGCAGEMRYLARSAAERADPSVRFPWVKSILCVGMRYPSPQGGPPQGGGAPPGKEPVAPRASCATGGEGIRREPGAGPRGPRGRISCYALGEDYHNVMEGPISALVAHLRRMGAKEARAYVDTGPVLERDWAARSGLGWIGKNTTLINQKMGSWLFLGVILTDLELEADEPAPDRCGTCTDCIEACPTGALTGPYLLDSRLCISYLTIEYKGVLPAELRGLTGDWVFGCDICQSVCPWNSVAEGPTNPALSPRPGLLDLDLRWALSNPDALSNLISGTALERARGERLVRNLVIAAGNTRDPTLAEALEPYVVTASSGLAEQVSWALKRLRA